MIMMHVKGQNGVGKQNQDLHWDKWRGNYRLLIGRKRRCLCLFGTVEVKRLVRYPDIFTTFLVQFAFNLRWIFFFLRAEASSLNSVHATWISSTILLFLLISTHNFSTKPFHSHTPCSKARSIFHFYISISSPHKQYASF